MEHVLFDLFQTPSSIPNLELLKQASTMSESLGRLWEAHAWAKLALVQNTDLPWARQTIERLLPQHTGYTTNGARV